MQHNTVLRQSFVVTISFSIFPTLRQRHVGFFFVYCPTTPPCSTRVDVLETNDVPVSSTFLQVKNLRNDY